MNARSSLAAGFLAVVALALPAAHAAGDGRSGKQVVDATCAACHGTGAQGAPKIGDRKAWAPRASQGLTSLTQHALEGIRKMPAHGGSPGLSDLEIQRAITYMVNRSGGRWVEPAPTKALLTERSGEQVAKDQCVKCHEAGVGGAPRIGDRAAWTPRMSRGIAVLVRSAIRGHGGMPPRGGQANLTDSELRNAVLYLYNPGSASAAGNGAGAAASARNGDFEKRVGGLRIFLGFVPAESLRGMPANSVEQKMHGGVPAGSGYYHMNVSLFDSASNAPIPDARIEARVEQAGMGGETKKLERMSLDAASYGAYVRAEPHAHYQVILKIRTAGSPSPVEARFEHNF